MDSILESIKKLLGIDASYDVFDTDIIMHINSVLMVLTQIGVGPKEGFMIADKYATWSDFLGDSTQFEAVKSYVYMRVRLLFDPPAGAVAESMNRMISELEWRLNVNGEKKEWEENKL